MVDGAIVPAPDVVVLAGPLEPWQVAKEALLASATESELAAAAALKQLEVLRTAEKLRLAELRSTKLSRVRGKEADKVALSARVAWEAAVSAAAAADLAVADAAATTATAAPAIDADCTAQFAAIKVLAEVGEKLFQGFAVLS